MSFQWPLVLLLLLLIPVLAAAYVVMQRRRTRYAVRFTNLDLLANVVSKTPTWRRHIPAVLLLLSTALLIVALARPRVEASNTREQGAIMLATDTSGSMTATDVKPDRITAARNAAKQFVAKIPKQVRLGLVTFDQAARLLVNPTTNRSQVNQALDTIQAQGGTAMGDALSVSVRALQSAFGPKGLQPPKRGQKRAPAEVVLLSDGKNTTGATDPIGVAQTAKRLGIRINTVALGTPTGTVQVQDNLGFTQTIQVPPDRPTLRQIASTTGGRFFSAPDASKLQRIYKDLGSRVKAKPVKKEVAYVPAAAAIVLMLAAGGFSLFWFGRLP
jgi:Ca-activated chloride channel homolog